MRARHRHQCIGGSPRRRPRAAAMTMTASEATSTRRATRPLVRRTTERQPRPSPAPRCTASALRRERRLTSRNCLLSSASTRSVRRFGMARTTVARAAARATMARAKLARVTSRRRGGFASLYEPSLRAAAPNGRTSPQRMRGRPPHVVAPRRCRQRRGGGGLACACAPAARRALRGNAAVLRLDHIRVHISKAARRRQRRVDPVLRGRVVLPSWSQPSDICHEPGDQLWALHQKQLFAPEGGPNS